jgi:hypothetical protein
MGLKRGLEKSEKKFSATKGTDEEVFVFFQNEIGAVRPQK